MTQSSAPKVRCKECEDHGYSDALFHHLGEHLKDVHDMDIHDYLEKYGPKTPFASNSVWKDFSKNAPEIRKGTKRFDNIIKVGGISLERQEGDLIKPFERPDNYHYPKKGDAAKAVERVARAVKYQRHLFIYGPAGAGKSASIRALSHDMNLEASHYPMREGLDPELFIGKEAVVIDEATGMNKTEFQKGRLLRDLEGRKGADGIVRGVIILMDDFDRAPAEYHEVFRHILEDNASNVFVPELGINIDVHPDTRVIATANSAGRGDMTGYYSSVQELDESILDRFQRVVQFHFLEPEEEKKILLKKFPTLAEADPTYFDDVIKVSGAIRSMIENQDIFASFSHRRLVQWLQSAEELLRENKGKPYPGLLREAANDWLEWYDNITREAVIKRTLDSVVPETR